MEEKNKRLAQTKLPDGSVVEREWSPRERYMLFVSGFGHGAAMRAMDPDREGLGAYDRGYAAGQKARGQAAKDYAEEIGYEPTILRPCDEEAGGDRRAPPVIGWWGEGMVKQLAGLQYEVNSVVGVADKQKPSDVFRNSDFAKAIRAACDEQEDAPGEIEGDGWSGSVGGACPVQGEGDVDGKWWYFRARHGDWTFDVFSRAPLDGEALPDEVVWSTDGDDPEMGWMRMSEARRIITECIAAYRAAVQHKGNE